MNERKVMFHCCGLIGWVRTMHAVQRALSAGRNGSRAGRARRVHVRPACEQLEVRRLLAAGTIDPVFGTGGEVTTSFVGQVDEADMVLVQPDGRLIVSGIARSGTTDTVVLARYTTEGNLDSSFGSGGKVTTPLQAGDNLSAGIALQADGRIVVVGSSFNGSNLDFAVARYTSTGNLDASFGSGGKNTFAFGTGDERARRVALQADGRIVVVGFGSNGSNDDFAVARLNSDGSFDSTFDGDGKLLTSFGSGDDAAEDVRIQPDGRIVVLGDAVVGGNGDFGVVRYNADGSLDSAFGSGGKVTTGTGAASNGDFPEALLLQPDGKLVAVGTTQVPTSASSTPRSISLLVRYTAAGALDGTFGSGGIATFDPGSDIDLDVGGAALQSNGSIVVAGGVTINQEEQLALLRFTSAGDLDTSFHDDGTVATFFNDREAAVRGVAIQADGKIVAAGGVSTGTDTEAFAVTRYAGDLIVPMRPDGWMYRAYNPNADYHFYTTSYAEFANAVRAGYRDETTYHTGFSVLLTQQAGSAPIYRLYNLATGRHYYTFNAAERDSLVNIVPPPPTGPDTRTTGWRYEKDEGFIFTAQAPGTTEIFRLYNKNSGVHLYTHDAAEKDRILAQFPGIWVQHSSFGFAFAGGVTSSPASAPATQREQSSRAVAGGSQSAAGPVLITRKSEPPPDAPADEISGLIALAANLRIVL